MGVKKESGRIKDREDKVVQKHISLDLEYKGGGWGARWSTVPEMGSSKIQKAQN